MLHLFWFALKICPEEKDAGWKRCKSLTSTAGGEGREIQKVGKGQWGQRKWISVPEHSHGTPRNGVIICCSCSTSQPVFVMFLGWLLNFMNANLNWLVVWNHGILFIPYIGNVIIPTDELIFFKGIETTNQLKMGWWMFKMAKVCVSPGLDLFNAASPGCRCFLGRGYIVSGKPNICSSNRRRLGTFLKDLSRIALPGELHRFFFKYFLPYRLGTKHRIYLICLISWLGTNMG